MSQDFLDVDDDDENMKIVIIGDSDMPMEHLQRIRTPQLELTSYQVRLNLMRKNIDFKFGYDTAGQERYRTITSAYYREAAGIIIVYDVTQENTFQNVKYWYNSISEHGPENAVVMLIGNKIDLKELKKVYTYQGEELAKHLEVFFLETSAKTEENIETLFTTIVEKIVKSKKRARLHNKVKLTPEAPIPRRNGGGGACGCE